MLSNDSGTTTCDRGCCEWDESGAVLRYTPHPVTRCAWCDEPLDMESFWFVEVDGRFYCDDKHAGKVDHDV